MRAAAAAWSTSHGDGLIFRPPYEAELTAAVPADKDVTVTLRLIGDNRDLLGPHHLKSGESYIVGPFSFFEESPLWCGGHNADWDDRYCFVRHGLAL